MGAWYATRESVKSRLDVKETARANSLVDDAIETASREVERTHLHRIFYPWTGTRYFDWPDLASPTRWRLWLDEFELISLTTLTVAGTAIASTDYFLEPANSGPPYDRIDIDRASSAAFTSGSTPQRSIAAAGLFGYWDVYTSAAVLAEALDASETAVDIGTSSSIGVGSILKVDSERMLVTERAMMDTTVNTGGTLTASTSDVSLAVANGTVFSVGEVILVDSERMLIVDISGNTLTLKRAWDGSVLASHLNAADIYAPRRLTVERGALGTTAATHSDAATVSLFTVPSGPATLTRAIAMNILLQDQSGWARTVGSGETERESSGAGLAKLIKTTKAAWGRNARTYAV